MEIEIWKPIPDYEGLYEVSNLGRVKRVASGRGTHAGRILNYSPSRGGYMRVKLAKNGGYKKPFVNRLVLLAFVGVPPHGYLSLHGDDNPQNNRLDNLRWGTHLENAQDCVNHGRKPSKLTALQVSEIRKLLSEGVPKRQLARDYGIHPRTIRHINRGEIWKSVP